MYSRVDVACGTKTIEPPVLRQAIRGFKIEPSDMAITIYKGKEDKDESQKDHLSTINRNFTKLGRKINTNYP